MATLKVLATPVGVVAGGIALGGGLSGAGRDHIQYIIYTHIYSSMH